MKPSYAVLLTVAAGSVVTPAFAESRTYDLPAFSEVSVTDGIVAIVEVGGAQAVTAEAASAAVLNRLQVEVRGNRLELHADWSFFDFVFNLGRSEQIIVRVATPEITAAEAASGANLDISAMTGESLSLEASSGASVDAGDVAGTLVRADSSSGARLKLAGTCVDLVANSSSGASLDARSLPCAAVEAEASSGAQVSVSTTRAIDAGASSGGGVVVYGTPTEIEVDSSSGGSVDFRQ
jgi:hypothetical protein